MKVSDKKKEKIQELIVFFLYSSHPRPAFTSLIASEVARDEEFVRRLLEDLKSKKVVVEVKKGPDGRDYARRRRWLLSDNAYKQYAQISR